MSLERWEANITHARQFYLSSEAEGLYIHVQAFLLVQAGELAIKAVCYKKDPTTNLEGHLSKQLLGDLRAKTGVQAPEDVKDAAERLKKHYDATRYPEETTRQFGCIAYQIGCWQYQPIFEDIKKDAKIIIDWAEKQIK